MPLQRRSRFVVNRGFTPRQIRRWETRIGELVDECLGQIEGRSGFDLVEDLAIPIPVPVPVSFMVISEMLGIDPTRRHHSGSGARGLFHSDRASVDRSVRCTEYF